MNELTTRPAADVQAYRASTEAADLCKQIVIATSKDIQGRNYVSVEGWQAIAVAHGCAAGARDVERIEGGVRAIGEIRRMSDGQLIATAEGFVGEDEPTWYGGKMKRWKWGQKRGEKIWYEEDMPKRADYAIRAMAQTRAISRACRSAFAHVVVMMDANLATTPAEEVTYDFQTGEVLDSGPAAGESIPGIHEIKQRLRRLKNLGEESQSLDAFEGLITTYQEDLTAIKEGKHEWWTGDGKDEEGYGRWINRRRKELTDLHPFGADEQFAMCLETLEACTSLQELAAWYKLNSKYVEQLDHESFDKVNTRYDELKAGFQLVDTATVGG